MTHEEKLEAAIENYVNNTMAEHDWKSGEFKVTILNSADTSDPLNQILVIGAKLKENGVLYGWQGEAFHSYEKDWLSIVKEAIKSLLTDMKKNPNKVITWIS